MSTIKVDNLTTTSGAGLYPAQAWANLNGTGTISIRADGNVSSFTDNGAGDYTMNFQNALQDANYSVVGMGGDSGTGQSQVKIITNGGFSGAPLQFTSSGVRIGATNADILNLCAQVSR
tara:strand:+ start:1155 stop:1511 length:357 start_codon:yes stop_codon:yes gene_type:complete